MANNIRIVIADDHPIVRQGLCDLLIPRNGMEVVGEAHNGQQAVELAESVQPDVVVMDLVMPQMNGAEAARRIAKENSQIAILILTSFGEEELLEETLKAGVLGYLLKDSPPEDLLQAIRSVNQGQLTLPSHLAKRLIEKPADQAQKSSVLTSREQEVMAAVARGLSNKEIAEFLDIGTNTVRSHISNILRKLNFSNRTQLALYAKEQASGA